MTRCILTGRYYRPTHTLVLVRLGWAKEALHTKNGVSLRLDSFCLLRPQAGSTVHCTIALIKEEKKDKWLLDTFRKSIKPRKKR
jgi:hypothetical protein